MQIIEGKGKVYDSSENYLDTVSHQIQQDSKRKNGARDWQKKMIMDNCVRLTTIYWTFK